MRRTKCGQAEAGLGGMFSNPMMLIGIALIAYFLLCQEDDDKDKKKNTTQAPDLTVVQANPPQSREEILGQLGTVGGGNLTCASQGGTICQSHQACSTSATESSDGSCCRDSCVTRIFATSSFSSIEGLNATIEKTQTTPPEYIVWWGKQEQASEFDSKINQGAIAHPYQTKSEYLGGGKYKFGARDENGVSTDYYFTLADHGSEISVKEN